MAEQRWIIGITGASGTVYARRLVRALVEHVPDVHLDVIVSRAALRVMHDEEGLVLPQGRLTAESLIGFSTESVSIHRERLAERVTLHSNRNIGADVASGSQPTRGMVIVPCSMKTLAAVAHGYAANLIVRAADVVLKERRPLVLVPRETPLSAIHLRNMLILSRAGAAIVPAMPGFYHNPSTIGDLVDLMVMRILDQMGYQVDLAVRWTGQAPAARSRQTRSKRTSA